MSELMAHGRARKWDATHPGKNESEDGFFIIILAGILISMLLIVGLAVDSGTLYNGQLATQSAADAAVTSGAALLAEAGSSADPAFIQASMEQMSRTNLVLKGIAAGSVRTITPSVNVGSGIVRIEIINDIPLRILRFVPGFAQANAVTATARARVRPAVVSLLLDTSFSMCCGANGGLCNPQPNCPLAGSKMEALIEAVTAFVNHFDPLRDNLNLIPYALGAEVLVPFQSLGLGFPKASILQQISTLRAGGATNLSDAFIRSYFETQRIGAENRVAYVLFSDGAPTAARLIIADGAMSSMPRVLNMNNVLGLPWSNYDYLNWSVLVNIAGRLRSIPYYPVYTPTTEWNPRLHYDVMPPPEATVVDRGPFPPPDPVALISSTVVLLELMLPDGSAYHLGSAWATGSFLWERFNYRQEYFNYPLAIADLTRKNGATWFAVGLGLPAPQLIDPDTGLPDPYQNAEQDFDRKDFFLTRLTNDPCGFVRQDPSFPGFPSYAELSASGVREGMYLSTPAAEDLTGLFNTIARRIKMQLIE